MSEGNVFTMKWIHSLWSELVRVHWFIAYADLRLCWLPVSVTVANFSIGAILFPLWGSGWIIGEPLGELGNSSSFGVRWPELHNEAFGTFLFCVHFTSFDIHSILFAFFRVFLPYFIIVVSMRKCWGQHLCMSSTFSTAILLELALFAMR